MSNCICSLETVIKLHFNIFLMLLNTYNYFKYFNQNKIIKLTESYKIIKLTESLITSDDCFRTIQYAILLLSV